MNTQNRQTRAKRRAKSNRLVRQGVPFTVSKWDYMSAWTGPGSPRRLTPGDVQSNRRLARYADPGMWI
jgi:hypothetical protein